MRKLHPLRVFAITSANLYQQARIELLVRVFTSRGAGLTPTRFGYCQPLKQKFSIERIEEITTALGYGTVLWRAPKSVVDISDGKQGFMYSCMSAHFATDTFAPDELTAFVLDAVAILQPVLCIVHLLNEHDHMFDRAKRVRVDAADEPFFGIFSKGLAHGLPDFYWGMVFGKPYCDLFGIERLLATPAHTVKQLGESLVYVQLTADVNDCEHNHPAIMQARRLAKKHLGPDAFMPDERDGVLSKMRLTPVIGKLVGHKPLVPVLVP